VAPPGTIINELPEQMLPLFAVTVGVMFTITVLVAVLEPKQPAELVPVTV
jgi:hypothetical protein